MKKYIIRDLYPNGDIDCYMIVETDNPEQLENIIERVKKENECNYTLDDLCDALIENNIEYYPIDDYFYF